MSARRWTRPGVLAIAFLATTSTALAAAPTHADLCNKGAVVRERLALFALTGAGVSRNPERWADANPAPAGSYYYRWTPAQRVLVDPDFCAAEAALPDGAPKCGKDDAKAIAGARNIVYRLLEGMEPGFATPDDGLEIQDYFGDPARDLRCVTLADGSEAKPPAPIKAPIDFAKLPFRVRGSTDGLQFDRDKDDAFAGVEKATISFKDDGEAKKESFKIAVLLGLVVPITRAGDLEAVPYIGIVRDSAKKDGEPKDVTTDIYRAGVQFDYRFSAGGGRHILLVRPEYSANRVTRSEVESINLTYVPIFNEWMNAYRPIMIEDQAAFSFIPRLDLRLNAGHFGKQGLLADEDSRDFVRIGGQAGVTLVSNLKWLPLEATLTETYLKGLRGNPGHLSQLRGVLSLALDEKKFFSLDLGYTRGRREDLLPREEVWSIGFGGKF